MPFPLCRSLLVAAVMAATTASADSFYSGPPLFSTRPDETKSVNTIDRFGPVGIGIELHQPAFVMKVKNVEPGSPAAMTGRVAKGQVIASINGQSLAAIDPRIQLGEILAEAEATDGRVRLLIRADAEGAVAEEVVVTIPVLGRYSPTWPLDCPKSEKIVRGFAEYLARPKADIGFGGIGMLFLLSTGEEQDLERVRQWVHGLAGKSAPVYAWHLGYGGIPLCEYYLRTGDEVALPIIDAWAESARKGEYLDGWAGRGGVPRVSYGNGHLNAGGTAVVTFLLLAKECGVRVDDSLLSRTLTHFFRFAGRGHNPYGDDRPEGSFVDNGKNGNLAFAMAAAASLTPEGEKSIYARARDITAMSSFYTTTFMLHGHTGGGIGEIWRSAAMGLLADTKPRQYRDFMDARRWHYDLSRRFDGSFGILGGAGYDKEEWGAAYALTYTIPRKTLRITGRPTTFAKPFPLPERPWGTAADDAFLALEAAADAAGTRQDISSETIANDSALPLIRRLTEPGTVDDELMQQLIRHPDPIIRQITANNAMGIEFNYMWLKPGDDPVRMQLIHDWIRDPDPRIRRAALHALARFADADRLGEQLPPPVFTAVVGMLADPEESWWVQDAALFVIARGTADMIAPHVEVIIPFLDHPEQWLQNAALVALTPVVSDERCYRQVLPAIGRLLRSCERWSTTAGPITAIREHLKTVDGDVQQLAADTLREVYTDYAGVKTWPGGQDIATVYDSHLELLAGTLADVPGGYDILYEVARQRYPDNPLPYAGLFLTADSTRLGPDLREKVRQMTLDHVIPEYVATNKARLADEAAAAKQISGFRGMALNGLVDLYDNIDIRSYDWHPFGPELRHGSWDYFSFDPPETKKYDISPWRYRPVTLPAGMEDWFMPGFDVAQAGWKRGQAPFGQFEGRLVTDDAPRGPEGRFVCTDPMKTLWEKEVLLVRGTFAFPPLQPGHLYRIRLGNGEDVGRGDGYRIYVNGRQLVEVKEGIGRRAAGPRGAIVTREIAEEFAKGPVTIAAMTFLRYGNRAIVTMPPVPQGMFSLWVEEMKVPPLEAPTESREGQINPGPAASSAPSRPPGPARRE